MSPVEETDQALSSPAPPGRTGRARDAGTRAAHRTWRLIRRIHLGTREPENWVQLFKFGLVGGSGYLINLAVFALLDQVLGIHHLVAAVLSFCVAVSNNFLLNRHWTFQATGGHAGFQAASFFTVSLLGLGVNLVLLFLLVDVGSAPELPSQAIAVAGAMPLNFIGNKLWTFRTARR
jgi:dolichol-phosphate mannosyltransferase